MTNRRRALAGLVTVATLGLAIAGCGTDNSGGDSPSPTPADPKQALVASVKALADGNFKFTITDHESTGSGFVHAPSKSAQLEAKSKSDDVEFSIGFITIDKDRWIKLDLGAEINALAKIPDSWMHIDPAKLKDSEMVEEMDIDFANPEEVDPAGAAEIFKGLVTAEQTGDGAYSGTVDLSKATDAGVVDETIVSDLADKAKAIPFTAALDGDGRLTKLTLDIPAAGDVPAHKVEVTYSDFGSASAAEKPPANQTREAPASAYEMLNS